MLRSSEAAIGVFAVAQLSFHVGEDVTNAAQILRGETGVGQRPGRGSKTCERSTTA